jgi:omega-6 fatty acid desaturase (delta-12 desaturase)
MIFETELTASPSFSEERALMRQTRAFARPILWRAILQIIGTSGIWLGLLVGSKYLGLPASLFLIPFIGLMVVRTFVLQHDCGHASFVHGPRWNHTIGRFLAVITGVAYDAWRTEHDWHHQVQGRLDKRGVDLFNSPMTVDEALQDTKKALAIENTVKFHKIAWLGMLALLIDRRRRRAFFMWRPGYSGKTGPLPPLVVNLWLNNALHFSFHIGLGLYLGWVHWLCLIPASYVFAGMFGSLLFWVQHNYRSSYSAPGTNWNFKDAAMQGSSYLRLPMGLRWFTADIGIHHVHHLNPCIPNYRLEEARTQIAVLKSVKPLDRKQMIESFTYHYWDPGLQRRVSYAEILQRQRGGRNEFEHS